MTRLVRLPLGVALALAAVVTASAQPPANRIYRIGVLETTPLARNAANIEALKQGLRELGYAEAYGTNYGDMYRRSASYVDRIFKGAKPGNLPIEQATRFELVINLPAARALGLKLPTSLTARADELLR